VSILSDKQRELAAIGQCYDRQPECQPCCRTADSVPCGRQRSRARSISVFSWPPSTSIIVPLT
jgi:hypothetical protein